MTGGYGAAEGRRKQTKGRSENEEWRMLGGSLEREREREENVNKINSVWLWWEVGWRDNLAGTGEGIHDEPKRGKIFGLDLGLSFTFSWIWV